MALGSLAQRVVTALVLAAVLLPAFLLLPKDFGTALVTAFVLGAAWEWSAFLGTPGTAARAAYVAFLAAGMAATAAFGLAMSVAGPVLGVGLLWWVAAFALLLRFPVAISPVGVATAGLLVLFPAWFAMLLLLHSPVYGRSLLLLVIAVTCAADVGAYFAGRRFGRVKLAPRVSPGKTWEGVLGGLVLAAIVAAFGAVWLDASAGLGVLLGLSVGAISIVGDLTASMFKRSAGLKDSGNLFPGHGGILDRIDSLTAAAPLFVVVAGWLGWLGR